jgi:hypothetical protein
MLVSLGYVVMCLPQDVDGLLAQCRDSPVPYLLPDKPTLVPPGGQLVHCLSGHRGEVVSLDLSLDGGLAVTACKYIRTCMCKASHPYGLTRLQLCGIARIRPLL